ncbi:hypothetical protein D621_01575 [beta proteobacterium AAP51]|nr:hypothetical protein D621_01575 [beta proteobacterium AAP51]
MKGDFSYFPFDSNDDHTGVLHQQGRVLLDRDWNAQREIDARWQRSAAADTFGHAVMAVPASEGEAFKVMAAHVDGDVVRVQLAPGRGWASGLLLHQAAPLTLTARYVGPPLAPAETTATVEAGTRDAVLLEVWEDSVSGFQDPADLIEPALGGPDTTARTKTYFAARLLRLGPNDDCRAVARLVDDPSAQGRLTVSPSPVLAVVGDCPLEAGGGYTGLEHYLYRIEVAEPAGGQARFKWSQFNGGLVGRGIFTAGALPATGTVDVLANVQAIELCGLDSFYLEALVFEPAAGAWRVACTADATRAANGQLALANVQGAWPTVTPSTAFFRLWNGIARVADFPSGAPTELKDGIRLEFDAATATNYRPGDFWSFPVRASGAAFAAPMWPTNAPPAGVVVRRVALAEIHWNAAQRVSFEAGQIEDCRRIFRPLTNQKICCTYNVGDGRTSFGDFNRIEDAVRHLPAAGGEICLLPGLHHTRTIIRNRVHITIRGCGEQTKVTPREQEPDRPIFQVVDASDIQLLDMDLFTMGGTAIEVLGSQPGQAHDLTIAGNRMLACMNAVRAHNVAQLQVHHNRIRMLDKRDSGVAIYLAGDDSRIERNDLRLVPYTQMPPIDVPDQPDPIDPTDPCARIEQAFANPRIFLQYVNVVWAVLLPRFPLFTLQTPPYRALGGIQLAGGCERVKVLDNTIVGGAGNGITLGAVAPLPPPGPTFSFEVTDGDARTVATVFGPEGRPLAGVQITLTPQGSGNNPPPQLSNADGRVFFSVARGTYAVTEGAVGLEIGRLDVVQRGNGLVVLEIRLQREPDAPPADNGFLYDITLERNTVSAMGLSGIGVPSRAAATGAGPQTNPDPRLNTNTRALATAQALLGSPVVGLVIRGNTLSSNLRNPFDNALRQEVLLRGVGGISLGLVDDALITDNRIENNASAAVNPHCGIFVQYGEDVDIQRNQVLDNGRVPSATTGAITNNANVALVPGQRGGIVLSLVSSFSLLAQLRGGTGTTGARPAARVHDNTVVQPVGCALVARAMGSLSINDNSFASEFAGPTAFEQIAGTVLVLNLGGVQAAGAGQDMRRPGSLAGADDPDAAPPPPPPPAAAAGGNLGMNSRARAQPVSVAVARPAATARLLPDGCTLFNDNQSRTGPANRATGCQLLLSFDDVGYAGNQSLSAQATPVFANAIIFAATVRATGNRWKEQNRQSTMSAFTVATRANNTSFNQGDHCIIVLDTNPGMPEIQTGNQVLFPSALCRRVNMTTTLLFKPLG